jgi:hypothetical protein
MWVFRLDMIEGIQSLFQEYSRDSFMHERLSKVGFGRQISNLSSRWPCSVVGKVRNDFTKTTLGRVVFLGKWKRKIKGKRNQQYAWKWNGRQRPMVFFIAKIQGPMRNRWLAKGEGCNTKKVNFTSWFCKEVLQTTFTFTASHLLYWFSSWSLMFDQKVFRWPKNSWSLIENIYRLLNNLNQTVNQICKAVKVNNTDILLCSGNSLHQREKPLWGSQI